MKILNVKYIPRFFVLSACVIGVASCSAIPKKTAQMTTVSNASNLSYAVYDHHTVSEDMMPSTAAVRWEDFYADKQLKSLIELALQNNQDMQLAILAVQSARAKHQISSVSDLPQAGASLSASHQGGDRADSFSTQYHVGLAMSSYELDLWGKVASQKQQALQQYLATAAAKEAVQISLISSVAQSYVNLAHALAQRQLAVQALQTREQSVLIAQKRFEAGLDSKSASLQAMSLLESARLAIHAADTEILQARNALQLLIGRPVPEELLPVNVLLTNITTQTIFNTGLPSELLYYRPDIVQAEHRLKAAGANIDIARAAYFPSIRLASNLGYGSGSLDELLTAGVLGWSFAPTISLPIFDAGVRQANYAVARIAQKSALVDYEKTIATAFKEVSDVLAQRATLQQRINAQMRLQDTYQQAYQIAYARFRSGLDSYLTVLEVQRSLFNSQQNLLQLQLAQALSQIQLYQALGGGANLDEQWVKALHKQREFISQSSQLASQEQRKEKAVHKHVLASPEFGIKPLVEDLTTKPVQISPSDAVLKNQP